MQLLMPILTLLTNVEVGSMVMAIENFLDVTPISSVSFTMPMVANGWSSGSRLVVRVQTTNRVI